MVSPYLNRRLRSLDEVLRARDAGVPPAREMAAPQWREDPVESHHAAAAPVPGESLPAVPLPPTRRAA